MDTERRQRQTEYETKQAEYVKRTAAAIERRGARQAKEADDAVSESSWCSASTAATLSLSLMEEHEARKMERKLRDISRLQDRRTRGEVLDKLQLDKIDSKAKLDATVVMLKIRAGAIRPVLASAEPKVLG